jgi:hypothetical protein
MFSNVNKQPTEPPETCLELRRMRTSVLLGQHRVELTDHVEAVVHQR